MPSSTWSAAALLAVAVLLHGSADAQRLCRGSHPPAKPDKPFSFCTEYTGSEACLIPIDSDMPRKLYAPESMIRNQFHKIAFGLHPQRSACAALIRKMFCATADPWSAEIFTDTLGPVPVLCGDFAGEIWDACATVQMGPNPFAAQPDTKTTLVKEFGTRDAFQKAVRGRNRNCYGGLPVDQTKTEPTLPAPNTNYAGETCLRRTVYPVPSGTVLVGAVPYPTDYDLVALIDQVGVVSIVNLTRMDAPAIPFLDVSARTVSGLYSVAFHRDYRNNGRLFLSLNCKAGANDCKKDGDSVVDEYVSADPAGFATPTFVRRILYLENSFPLSFIGQLLFSPGTDPNLFVAVADGGQSPNDDIGDPLNRAQDLGTLFGKILRIDIDNIGRDGTTPYRIPYTNPFRKVAGAMPEIFAFGLRNPWRCSFDHDRPEFLFCGDDGHHLYEEIDRIVPGGNYGWRYYEGNHVYNTSSPLGPQPLVFPQIEYAHSEIGPVAAVIGGYVHRPLKRSCTSGTYYFGDFSGKVFSAIGVPNAGVYRRTPKSGEWRCATDSPVNCGSDLGRIFSFFQSMRGDLYITSSTAIYQIVEPTKCSLSCAAE